MAAVPRGDSKRVLIMMSNTGGGHRASAEALQAVFKELYGDQYEVRAAQGLGPAGMCGSGVLGV